MSSYVPNKLSSLASFLESSQVEEDPLAGLFATPPAPPARASFGLMANALARPSASETLLGGSPPPTQNLLGLIAGLSSPPPPPSPFYGPGMVARALMDAPPQSTLLGGLASAAIFPVSPWMHLTKRFRAFLQNLELTSSQIEDGFTKIHGVVSCLNAAYYGHSSKTANAFCIGSWAKGTKVRPPRDVDLYFILPIEVYNRFERYSAGVNRQSALLQDVKAKLLTSYPTSSIRGDGPVVLAGFTSYSVEVVPAFSYDASERSYYVTDTKNGGSYKKTMPLHEVDAIEAADVRNAANVRPLVRMLKGWQANCQVPIKSFFLELMAINFLDQYEHRHQGLFYYDWIVRDFFKWMIAQANGYLVAPGTYEVFAIGQEWKSRAETAFGRAQKACEFEKSNDMANAGDEWQKIFGNDIPKWV